MLLADGALDVREPRGDDELFLLETPLAPAPALVALAERVVTVTGRPLDWDELAAAQLGAVALGLRRAWIGDRILSEGRCPVPDCAARVDVSFSSASYLAHHRARQPRNVAAGDGGWYQLAGTPVRFRIPSVADLLAAGDSAQPAAVLASRCLDPTELEPPAARAVNRALAALAPSMESLVGGNCPDCGAEVALRFDPVTYTLAELRDAFAGVYRETHALASAYGWPEETILRQPRSRRQRYAALILDDRGYLALQREAAR
ncbi:MAG TPA: hypothetical protein VHA57_02875 [Actinomycetota bacterium]|nr:hypothetical protein [Actinomycetota bacterium]